MLYNPDAILSWKDKRHWMFLGGMGVWDHNECSFVAFTWCCHWICSVLDGASVVLCADHAWRCGEGTHRSKCAYKPTLVCRGSASVVFTHLTVLDKSCIVNSSGGGTYG